MSSCFNNKNKMKNQKQKYKSWNEQIRLNQLFGKDYLKMLFNGEKKK